uniref:Major facilitator superfamily (MFS) profile domain-containing protein n=1 Tax=Oncorhynchus mykiss TaxID=8022 RepID=A0A8C7T5W7_ONCMY
MAAGPERPVAEAQQQERDQPPIENGFVSLEQTQAPRLLPHVDGSVLPSLGGFGKHQKQLVILTWIPALFIGFSQFSDYFLLAQPNGTCVQPLVNGSNWTMGSLTLPVTVTNGGIGTLVPYLPLDNGTRDGVGDSGGMQCACKEWKLELQTGLSQNVVTKWNLVCDSAWKVHIAKFSLLVGSIFGYLVMGILADWFGRHPVLIVSVLFMLVFGLSVAFSFNVTMFSTLRFFEGFCLAGLTLSLYILRIELCLPGWRFSMTMVASFLMVGGQLVMPGVAALCRDWPARDDWQVLQIFIICPFVLMLPYIWIFPESLRWLLATQHYHRSKAMMLCIARKNQVDMTTEPKNTLLPGENILLLTGYGIHHCFARSMMDPEAPVSAMFHADYYTMAGIAVATCLALCPAVAFMGRRGGLLTFMIITALASLLQLGLLNLIGKYSLLLRDTLNRKFSVAFSIIGMFSSHAVSTLSIFFCAEITPTVIRGGGLGLVLASAGFGMLTAPIMELHNQKGYFLHHMIFAACTLLCIICLLLLPEPRNQPLPESLADGESYTRQPLLTHRPGEQHLLLTKPGDRDLYSRVHDTCPRRASMVGFKWVEM